jgi:hypothetical protein
MSRFQFDKCLDDIEVIDPCNGDNLVQALPLEEDLWNAKDPELLRVLMARSTPLVTIDRKLPRQHSAHIPDVHPGIIIVAYSQYIDRSKETLRTITTRAAAKILRTFKSLVPDWHQISVANSIVEITNKGVEISHVENGRIKFDGYLEYEKPDTLRTELVRLLHANSERQKLLPEEELQ